MELQTAHTADLTPATLEAARALLIDVFAGTFTDDDWEHALGGMHVLVLEDGDLVGHGSVVQRRMLYGGRALRAGYVEGIGVRADRRGRGYGRAIMEELDRVIRGAYVIGVLGATDDGARLYAGLGWRRWKGPTFALTPDGVQRTTDQDGAIFVLEVATELDVAAELVCDWRDGGAW